MRPTLLALDIPGLGEVVFPSYLNFMIVGFIAALIYLRRRAIATGIDSRAVIDLGLVCFVAALFGARLLSVLADGYLRDFIHLCTDPTLVDATDTAVRFCAVDSDCGSGYLCDAGARDAVLAGERRSMCYPPRDCLAALKFWQGGLTFYGGVLVAVPAGLLYARRRGLGALRMADLFAPAIALAQAIGKVGCFLNGCCYGAHTELFVGVTFPGHAAPRHPTQLYEATAAALIFAALLALQRRPFGRGALFGYFLVLHSLAKAAIELLRDDPRGALGPLSTSQLIAVGLFGAGTWLIQRGRRRDPPPS